MVFARDIVIYINKIKIIINKQDIVLFIYSLTIHFTDYFNFLFIFIMDNFI